MVQGEGTLAAEVAASCLLAGFFFLLRPGEYLGNPTRWEAHMFCLQDVQFWIGSRALNPLTCPAADLQAASFVTLTFTQQKNGVRNERIGHGRSGHPSLCPVNALVERVLGLRSQGATAETPLFATFCHPILRPASAPCCTFILTRPTCSPTCPSARLELAAPWRCCAPASTATGCA